MYIFILALSKATTTCISQIPLCVKLINDYYASMSTFLGVVVKPGETVKCDPGESYYNVSQVTFTGLFIIDLLTQLEVDPICLLLRRLLFSFTTDSTGGWQR